MNQLKLIDLCSGIGAGFPLAATVQGQFEIIGLCENDQFCRNILGKRFPRVPIYDDVRSLDCSQIERPTIITASPPCQAFSICKRNRLGADDERDCFPAILRAIAALRPRYFAIENVLGLLSCPYRRNLGKSSYFGNLVWLLSELGFDVQWGSISSGHFGSPWKRERLLILGVARGTISWAEGWSTPWPNQIRESIEKYGDFAKARGVQSPVSRESLQSTVGLDGPIGVPSGNRVNRKRRAALGNSLDWRVAACTLERILYWEKQNLQNQLKH